MSSEKSFILNLVTEDGIIFINILEKNIDEVARTVIEQIKTGEFLSFTTTHGVSGGCRGSKITGFYFTDPSLKSDLELMQLRHLKAGAVYWENQAKEEPWKGSDGD